MQHADAAFTIASQNQYPEEAINIWASIRNDIQIQIAGGLPNSEKKEAFTRPALVALGKATQHYNNGQYQDAIVSLKEAQTHHGKPSTVLEQQLGNSYDALNQHDLAIRHYSNSIYIEDRTIGRIHRAHSYLSNNQCPSAITDAKIALTMEPQIKPGLHTDGEANYILAVCYRAQSDFLLALQHAEAAITIGTDHQYSTESIEAVTEFRDLIRLEGNIP